MENKRYLKLTDSPNEGDIVKQVGQEFYGFINGTWKRRGLSVGYFLPDSPEYECYEILSEDKVVSILGEEARIK